MIEFIAWAVTALIIGNATREPEAAPPEPPREPRSYVILLPNEDGRPSAVAFTDTEGRTTLLEQVDHGLSLDAEGSGTREAFAVDPATVERVFAPVLRSAPPPVRRFVLYFELDSSELTAESQAALEQLRHALAAYDRPQLELAGHADTLGDAERNLTLSQRRVQRVREWLQASGVPLTEVTGRAYGERRLPKPTPDETAEPANRRVDVTVR